MDPSHCGAGAPEEIQVLLQLRGSTDGTNGGTELEGKASEVDKGGWKNSAGWPAPGVTAATSLVNWYGLDEGMVVGMGEPSHVCSIRLAGNNLCGPLPEGLDALRHLTTIDLACNDLTGGLPECLFHMPRLIDLDLRNNPRLGLGGLPAVVLPIDADSEAATCILHNVSLANCGFDGTIPSSLLSLLSFTCAHLDLSGNKLEGEIPDAVGEMTNLQTLCLGDNMLTGSCPLSLLKLMDVANPESQLTSAVLEGNKDLVASSFPNGTVNWTGERKDDY